MRIMIIGGGGFIGSNLRNALSKTEYEVHSFDLSLPNRSFENVTDHVVTDDADYRDLLQKGDVIIYLRWVGVPASVIDSEALSYERNVTAGIRFFEICREKQVGKIIFSSSGGAIYGKPLYTPIDEKHPLNPQSFYGVQKHNVEEYLEFFSKKSGIPILNLRISNPYGPGQRPFTGQGVVATFMASCLLGREVTLRGDGSYVRDYIYIDDLMQYFLAAIRYEGTEQVINIGSGKGISLNEISDAIEETVSKKLIRNYVPATDTDVPLSILNTALSHKEFGEIPLLPLKEGLKKMLKTWDEEKQEFVL